MNVLPSFKTCRRRFAVAGLTRGQLLLALALIVVVAVLSYPIYAHLRRKSHKQVTLQKMKELGAAISTYTNQSGGLLPAEDTEGNESWSGIAAPAAKDAWYNALPKAVGRKGAGEFPAGEGFYADENMVYLPGANYPDQKKLAAPQFAIAWNTKLERNDASGKKERVKLSQVTEPNRTVALLEQGCLNEDRTLPIQTKSDYDGSPKGSAKSFVGRYGGEGHLCFVDGSVRLVKASELLTDTGDFPFPPTTVVWSATPAEDPNKDAAAGSSKKKKK